MLLTKDGALNALEQAIADAEDSGITLDEISEMVAVRKAQTLNQLAMQLEDCADTKEPPMFTETPSGMVDVATAVKAYGIKKRTVNGWVSRGMVPVLGRIKGVGGTRVLICEKTVAKLATLPKNKGGRPRKT